MKPSFAGMSFMTNQHRQGLFRAGRPASRLTVLPRNDHEIIKLGSASDPIPCEDCARQPWKEQQMHRAAFLSTLASVALATSLAHAQAPSTPTQQSEPPGARETPASPPTIQRVRVVDMEELPAATQAEVNQMVVERGEAELQKLRRSIDAAPTIKSALEAKGLSSAHVIVASLANDGELTLVTRKSG